MSVSLSRLCQLARRLVCFGLLAAVSACTPIAQAPAQPPAREAAPSKTGGPSPAGDRLLIGGVADLGGPSATLGEGAKMGAELAALEINAKGGLLGRQVEMVYRDDQANPTGAVQAVHELISTERVKAIIGPVRTPTALAVAPAVSDAGVVNLQVATGSATVDPEKYPFVFRPQFHTRQEAEVMLDYFTGVKAYTRLAILADATAYGRDGVSELKPLMQARGIQLTAEEQYTPGATDMTGQLTRIMSSKAQGILAWGLGTDLGQAAKGMERLDSGLTILGPSSITAVGFRQFAGSSRGEHLGVYARRFSFSDFAPPHPPASAFISKLDATFGRRWTAQTVVSAPWYEAVNLYAEAVRRAGTDDPGKVKAALEALRDFPSSGIYTTYSFSPTNRNGFQTEDLAVVFAAGEERGLYRRPVDAR